MGMERFGCAVSSPRFAAVSKPMKISTPYSTPKKIPDQPVALELGRKGLIVFPLVPPLAMM